MSPAPAKRARGRRKGRFLSPARMVVLGAVLGFVTLLSASVLYLVSINAFITGAPDGAPLWLIVVNLVLQAFAGPVGIFVLLCGIAVTAYSSRVRAHLEGPAPRPVKRPAGRSPSFRLALSGAQLNLIGGLFVGLLNIVLFLLPEGMTLETFWTASVLQFVGTVVSGIGIFLAFCGIALIVASTPTVKYVQREIGHRIRWRRGSPRSRSDVTPAGKPRPRPGVGASPPARVAGAVDSTSSEIGTSDG